MDGSDDAEIDNVELSWKILRELANNFGELVPYKVLGGKKAWLKVIYSD